MSENVVTLIVVVSMAAGGLMGYIAGTLHALSRLLTLQKDNDKLKEQLEKMISALPVVMADTESEEAGSISQDSPGIESLVTGYDEQIIARNRKAFEEFAKTSFRMDHLDVGQESQEEVRRAWAELSRGVESGDHGDTVDGQLGNRKKRTEAPIMTERTRTKEVEDHEN